MSPHDSKDFDARVSAISYIKKVDVSPHGSKDFDARVSAISYVRILMPACQKSSQEVKCSCMCTDRVSKQVVSVRCVLQWSI